MNARTVLAFGSLIAGLIATGSQIGIAAVTPAPLTVASAANTQTAPAVAWGSLDPPCDKYLVVWQDKRNGVDDDIWAAYVNSDGTARLGTFNLTAGRAGNQRLPSVAWQPNRKFLVVWEGDEAGNADIYGREVDCKKRLGEVGAIASGPAAQKAPDVACVYGKCWVVWEDLTGGTLDIYGQRIAPGMVFDGANTLISDAGAADAQSAAAIAANDRPDAGCSLYSWMATWTDARDLALTGLDIWDQQLGDLGVCGGNASVYDGAAHQGNPDIAHGNGALPADDAYLDVWQDKRVAGAEIYGRRLDAWSGALGADFPIASAAGSQVTPAVAYDTALLQFLVVWSDNRNYAPPLFTDKGDIYAQLVNLDGTLDGANLVISTATGTEVLPAVAYNPVSARYLVLWSKGGDIYARGYWP